MAAGSPDASAPFRANGGPAGSRSLTMIQLLILFFFVYLAALGAAAYFTRPLRRRMMGALAGGAATGLRLPLLLDIAGAQGWWRCPFLATPGALLLACLVFAVSYAAIALIGWGVGRPFRWGGGAPLASAGG